jgi:hypothetical protein
MAQISMEVKGSTSTECICTPSTELKLKAPHTEGSCAGLHPPSQAESVASYAVTPSRLTGMKGEVEIRDASVGSDFAGLQDLGCRCVLPICCRSVTVAPFIQQQCTFPVLASTKSVDMLPHNNAVRWHTLVEKNWLRTCCRPRWRGTLCQQPPHVRGCAVPS